MADLHAHTNSLSTLDGLGLLSLDAAKASIPAQVCGLQVALLCCSSLNFSSPATCRGRPLLAASQQCGKSLSWGLEDVFSRMVCAMQHCMCQPAESNRLASTLCIIS